MHVHIHKIKCVNTITRKTSTFGKSKLTYRLHATALLLLKFYMKQDTIPTKNIHILWKNALIRSNNRLAISEKHYASTASSISALLPYNSFHTLFSCSYPVVLRKLLITNKMVEILHHLLNLWTDTATVYIICPFENEYQLYGTEANSGQNRLQ